MVDFETIRFNLRKVYLETGKYSEDLNFPANNYSLGHNRLVQWKRPHEILTNPQFIVNGISRFDVKQGELKNC
jgi:calpain